LVLMLLSGCANTEPTPQYLYRAVPRVWTDTIAEPSLDGTYGAYMARCELFIKQCNADRQSVRRWTEEAEGTVGGSQRPRPPRGRRNHAVFGKFSGL
jgi:hypothetical protein